MPSSGTKIMLEMASKLQHAVSAQQKRNQSGYLKQIKHSYRKIIKRVHLQE
jgi:hypothetical protein